MHETRFINEIFAVLKQKLGKGAASAQVVVSVRLSPFSHVKAENLKVTFKELSKGENLKNVRLKVLPLEILLECKDCNRSMGITKKVFCCPCATARMLAFKWIKNFSWNL